MSGRYAQYGVGNSAQLVEEVVNSVERPFRKKWIGPQSWQEQVVGFDHLENGGGRACEIPQNDVERFSNQPEAAIGQWSGQLELGKNNPMAFKDQWTAVHQSAVEIEND